MPTVTWEDLQDFGFARVPLEPYWEKVTGRYVMRVDVTHNDPRVWAVQSDDYYGLVFHGCRSRADLETLIRLLGEPA
jgi:hypothetical protein